MSEPLPADREGLILRVDAKVCHVELADGQVQTLPLRGRLFEKRTYEKRPIAVGDRVRVHLDDDGGAIEEVLPRTSALARRSAGEGDRRQVMAANITLVLVVASTREPPFQPDLVDRILAGAAREGIEAAIAFTKMDRDKKGAIEPWVELYRELGYAVFPTSIAAGKETPETLAAIETLLHENRTALAGLSGAGKSSLLNHLMPELDLRVGSLSRIRQGKHTTSHTQLIPLPGGGHVLDTPGIRNFGLFGVGAQEVGFLFREIAELQKNCAYRNCTHTEEPDCALQTALDTGALHPSRYANYVDLLGEAQQALES